MTGDFDRDGKEDDIAAFYDYNGGQTRIHVWLSNGNGLKYQGSAGWWSATGYTASRITGQVVPGDFNRDWRRDDIAAFYDYGEGQTGIHIWKLTGSGFAYQGSSGWWSAFGYTAGRM